MKTLAVNSNNDLYADQSGSLIVLTGLDAVTQSCENYSKSQLGEMFYQVDLGVNYFGFAFDNVNLNAFRNSLIENILRVPDVIEVTECDVNRPADSIQYTATIKSNFGIGALNA